MFLARGLVDQTLLDEARRYIRGLISIRLDEAGVRESAVADRTGRFDDGFAHLNKIDRTIGGIIYRASRRLMPIHQLSVDKSLCDLSKALMGTDLLISCNLKAVRIDHPDEDTYLFEWHQDYPYIQDSEDGVVYWIPLHDVDETNGALEVALGSHRDGVRPVRSVDPENVRRNGARTIEIADAKAPESYPRIRLPMRYGEALVFSSLLLHRSAANRSPSARWTVQIRHGNFRHPAAIARDWPGGMIEGETFDRRHPDLVASAAPRPSIDEAS